MAATSPAQRWELISRLLHDDTLTLAGLPGSIGTAGDAYDNAQAETDASDNAQAETTETTVGLYKSGRHRDGSP